MGQLGINENFGDRGTNMELPESSVFTAHDEIDFSSLEALDSAKSASDSTLPDSTQLKLEGEVDWHSDAALSQS